MTRSGHREKAPLPGDETEGILDLLDDGIVLADASGKILLINSAMERLSGMSLDASRGMALRDFVAAGIAPRLTMEEGRREETLRILVSGEDGEEAEFPLPARGGERWFSASSRPVTGPPWQGGRFHVYRDITKERRAIRAFREREGRLLSIFLRAMKLSLSRDRELTERERRLSAIFEAAHNVAFVTSELRGKESRILDFSPGAEMIFGYWKNEVVGERLAILHLPEDLDRLAEIHRKMKRQEIEYSGEITLVRKGGEQFPALLTKYPLKDEAGSVRAALTVVIDITILKRAEAQIRASLEEKENLLREIHHRVKNNMQVVSALLVLQSKKTKDRKILEMFRDSEHRIKTMALIHEKLYQSRSFGTIDLAEYLTRLIQYLFRSYEELSAGVTLDMDVRDVSLDLDTALPVSLIINELVSNSLKYAFPGGKGGKICIRARGEEGQGFVLEIRDSGVGLPRGFDLGKAETLGLHLVRGLAVDQLGGSIEQGTGKGTSFIIRVPEMKKQRGL
ncbi:MAG TPA: PAS domain S-box protein [Methanomicrobiales archaeon]|nr:PAS domain S-box protein [Methanomicrobiales archaeon]